MISCCRIAYQQRPFRVYEWERGSIQVHAMLAVCAPPLPPTCMCAESIIKTRFVPAATHQRSILWSLVLLFGALLCIAYSSHYPLSDMVGLLGLIIKAIMAAAESTISSIQHYLVRRCITKPCNIGDDGVIWTWYAIMNNGPGLIMLVIFHKE